MAIFARTKNPDKASFAIATSKNSTTVNNITKNPPASVATITVSKNVTTTVYALSKNP